MRCRTLGKPGWPWAGVCFALLACGLFAPTAARAGCGNHVPVSSYLSDRASPFDPLILGGLETRSADQTPPTTPTENPRPCTGAMCSGQPGVPPSPIATFSYPAEDWAWQTPPSSADDSTPAADPRAEAALRPTHFDPSVFHPPRPSHPFAWSRGGARS